MKFEIKITENITMGLLEESDAQNLYNLIDNNRSFFRRFLSWVDDTTSVEHSLDKIRKDISGFNSGESLELGIFFNAKLIGRCGFISKMKHDSAEIGYLLDDQFTRLGIMTQCVKALTEYGINTLKKHRIVIKMNTMNVKSRSIPERLNYIYEGTERESSLDTEGNWRNTEVWSFIAGDDFSNPKIRACCPVCKSARIGDSSIYRNNGVIGPGYHSHKDTDQRTCLDCGVNFTPTIKNGFLKPREH